MAQTRPQTPLGTVSHELARIRKNTEEAIKLISTITGPLEQVELEPTDVHFGLEAAVKSCWWPENVRLSRQLGRDIPPVKANAKRLEAVFHNLLSNGIQALTPQGGEIRLQTGLTADGEVEIIIADDGPGIPAELQSQMFNPGVSGTEGGLGIGLWLVETFVHQFDGRIEFTSSESEGTTFVVTLQPLVEDK
jgi:two-component system C4-dicarboxylate transport sensor histidine kinase DctB